MLLCYQSFTYLPSINSCVRKSTSQSKKPKNQALVKFPASIIPQSEEINSFSGQLIDQANAIGIIGGLSVNSCVNFTEKLNFKLQDEENELPFVLCTDPALSNELLSLERSYFPSLSGKTERFYTNQRSIVENLRRKRAFLENCGVCCVVMPCHVSHCWYDEIRDNCCVPFLHMGGCVAKELREEKLRPIEAGSHLRIGILATNTTLVAKMYREKLENEGFEVIIPDKATMEHIVIPAMEALSRKDFEGAQNLFRIAVQVLLVRGVNRIILASDDLQQLLPPDDPLWRKCIDPIDALARSTFEYAQSVGRCK